MEPACVQPATLMVPPAVATHLAAALAGGSAALFIALVGWWANRRDWAMQARHLRVENEQLTESLRLALYAKGGTGA